MPLYSFEGKRPDVHPDAWVAPTATLVGDVTVRERASVWYGVVIRADFGPVVVDEGANVQDNTVIHTGESGTVIGAGATVGHACVVHTAHVGVRALVGNAVTVLDGASVGEGALVAAGALVPPGAEIPGDVIAMGSPAKKLVPMTESARVWVDGNPHIYQDLARRHRDGIAEA